MFAGKDVNLCRFSTIIMSLLLTLNSSAQTSVELCSALITNLEHVFECFEIYILNFDYDFVCVENFSVNIGKKFCSSLTIGRRTSPIDVRLLPLLLT